MALGNEHWFHLGGKDGLDFAAVLQIGTAARAHGDLQSGGRALFDFVYKPRCRHSTARPFMLPFFSPEKRPMSQSVVRNGFLSQVPSRASNTADDSADHPIVIHMEVYD
jgi:hypothetical protein